MTKDQLESIEILRAYVHTPEYQQRRIQSMHEEAEREEKRLDEEWLNGSWKNFHIK